MIAVLLHFFLQLWLQLCCSVSPSPVAYASLMPVPMEIVNDDAGSCVAAGESSQVDDDIDMGGTESEGSTASGTSSRFQDTSFNQDPIWSSFHTLLFTLVFLDYSCLPGHRIVRFKVELCFDLRYMIGLRYFSFQGLRTMTLFPHLLMAGLFLWLWPTAESLQCHRDGMDNCSVNDAWASDFSSLAGPVGVNCFLLSAVRQTGSKMFEVSWERNTKTKVSVYSTAIYSNVLWPCHTMGNVSTKEGWF